MLTPLAVSHADVLRYVHSHLNPKPSEIAEATGRIASNVKRDLAKLATEGLLHPEPLVLTDAGMAAVQALARADASEAAGPALPAGVLMLLHEQITPDALNPRKDFDDEGLAELADSIAANGLMQNLTVRALMHPDDTVHRLVAGERRWRAIFKLMTDGRWPRDRPILCQVQDITDEEHAERALVENLQRRDLKPLEEADGLKRLMETSGQGTAEIAKRIGFTQRFVQQRLQLLELPPIKRVELEKGRLTIEQARTWLANRPRAPDLPDADWLIALEVYDKLRRDPIAPDSDMTEVHADARFAKDELARISDYPVYILTSVNHVLDEARDETGRFQIGLSYYGEDKLKLKFGDGVAAKADLGRHARAEALDVLRQALGLNRLKPGYSTKWLNGPFEIREGLRQEIEAARAKSAEGRAARAEQDREREEAAQAHQIRYRHAAEIAARLRAAPAAEPISSASVAELADLVDIVLPVRLDQNASVVDATGRELVRSGVYHGRPSDGMVARSTLFAVAINTAAGLATPEDAPANDTLPREEFVRYVANCLAEDIDELDDDTASAMAQKGLATYLADSEVDYGADRFKWNEDAAMSLAESIRVDGYGQAAAEGDAQIDLEEAIAKAEDEDGTPEFLRRIDRRRPTQ